MKIQPIQNSNGKKDRYCILDQPILSKLIDLFITYLWNHNIEWVIQYISYLSFRTGLSFLALALF